MIDLTQIITIQQQAVTYLYSLPDEVMSGNVFAIVLFLFLLYIAIFIIQKFTTLLVFVLKKVFLLIIVVLAFYEFVQVLALKMTVEGITSDVLFFGAAGTIIGLLAIITALYVALHSINILQRKPKSGAESTPLAEEEVTASDSSLEVGTKPQETGPTIAEKAISKPSLQATVKENLSLTSLKSDKHIGAVIAYIIIAEFGVFSSKTIAAPTLEAGLSVFVVFMLASVVFIRLTYHDYWKGIRHLTAALVVGGALSIILGYFWGAIPLEILLSLSYFTTDALVALITGLALSLFMGSMN